MEMNSPLPSHDIDDIQLDLPYHTLSHDEVLKKLQVDVQCGLSNAEADIRRQRFGPNQLPAERSKTVLERLWAQINSVLIYVLLAGAALSFGFHHLADGVVILGVIVVNVSLGISRQILDIPFIYIK
jgi:magnesium-transporting ATPase (P-type)